MKCTVPLSFFMPHRSRAALTQTPSVETVGTKLYASCLASCLCVLVWIRLCLSRENGIRRHWVVLGVSKRKRILKTFTEDDSNLQRYVPPIPSPYFSAERTQIYSTWLSQQSLHKSQTNDWHTAVCSEWISWATPEEHLMTVWCHWLGSRA